MFIERKKKKTKVSEFYSDCLEISTSLPSLQIFVVTRQNRGVHTHLTITMEY